MSGVMMGLFARLELGKKWMAGHAAARILDNPCVESFKLIAAGEDVLESRLRRTAMLWFDAREPGSLAERSRMNLPFSLKKDMHKAILFDVLEGGGYRYRLVGSSIVYSMGYDCTGLLVEEVLSEPFCSIIKEINRLSLAESTPVYAVFSQPFGKVRRLARLCMPIREGEQKQILVVSDIVFETAYAPKKWELMC